MKSNSMAGGRKPWWRRPGRVLALGLCVPLVGCCGIIRRANPAPEPLPAASIVDLHCHVAGLGGGGSGCRVSEHLRHNWRTGFYFRGFGVSRKELEAGGDTLCGDRLAAKLAESSHVGRAVVLALDGPVDAKGELDLARTEFYVPNEFVAALAEAHTNLLFGASINPRRTDALARLEWAAAHHAVLIKWLPSIQLIDPADEALIPFYRRMAALGLPLLVHTGAEGSFTWSRDEFVDPARLRLPLSQGVTVIAAHAAWSGRHGGEADFDRLARLMTEFPRLYADISSLTQINKLGSLRDVLRRPEMAGRLVYGSDFPLINTPLVSPWYYPLDLSLRERFRLSRIKNPWDRDVALKQALGVPASVFSRGAELVRAEAR